MTCVGNGGELGKDARVSGAGFVELDVRDGLQAPIQTRPLGVGKRRGEFLELSGVQEEEAGAKTINGRTGIAVGGVWDGDVVKDGEAGASGFEFGADDFEEVGHLQTLKVKGAGRGRRGDGGVGGGGLRGGDAGGERETGEALLEGTALLLSTLLGGETLDGGAVAGLTRVNFVPISGGEGARGYAGRFGDVLNDRADVASRVMVWAARLATRLDDVGDELGEVAAKTRLRSGARFARHYQMRWVRYATARAASKLTG